MNNLLRPLLLACVIAGFLPSAGAGERDTLTAAGDLKYELGGLAAGITYLGLQEWNWGSGDFRFNNEGWFGMDTGSGGADKLGHLYSAYVIGDFLSYRLARNSGDDAYGAHYGALFAWGTMVFVEVFDGFSKDHGFSYEDLLLNTAGVGISWLRNTVPGLRDKLDLRIEYTRSDGAKGFHPVTDYSGMKYLAAVKLAGFESLRDTPLKYLELHTGYYTRGFLQEDAGFFAERETHLYLGLGLNLEQLLFNHLPRNRPTTYANTFFKYIQVPHIYTAVDVSERRRPR